MKIKFVQTIRNYDRKNLGKDLVAGLIIMAVSIPISMGYAQIAGLPAVYGLYGSVFPIIMFALLSTSPQFIFSMMTPAALIGAALLDLHIESRSKEALAAVPVLTAFVALWAFRVLRDAGGEATSTLSSAPVMGSFIAGICTTIILMQVPKLLEVHRGDGRVI